MAPLRPTTRRLLLALAVAACYAAGWEVWQSWQDIDHCTRLPLWRRLSAAVWNATGLVTFQSQSCQDRWVVLEVYPDVRNGYFLDVGSADGVIYSNSKVLEDLGWEGVCVDPFPKNMADRRCRLFTNPVYSESGKRVRFRTAGSLGGIETDLGRWEGITKGARVVELETRTLTELLADAKAPKFIHYMSMDIEGAELEALKGLDFSGYHIGAMTIEHNFEEPKRSQIRALLEGKGYRYVRSVDQDDYYEGPRR